MLSGRLALVALALAGLFASADHRADDRSPPRRDLIDRGAGTASLDWLPSSAAGHTALPGVPQFRPAILAAKQRALADGDARRVADANAVLASESFIRASRLLRLWIERRDPATGLWASPRGEKEGTAWVYGDTGADLFPHLAIGAFFLAPERYPEILATLAAERAASPALPDDLLLPGGSPANGTLDERLFGAAEYAKDGLLPLVERLGPDPWLGRLVEVAEAVLATARTPTRRGPIPADSAEVNGDMLQVLARAYWATGDERLLEMAERIGRVYVEDVLPTTRWLPPHRWDFIEKEPIERRRFRLSDHGNEILLGLVEWHLIETLREEPDVAEHRVTIRRMLDRLLEKGRNRDGLWFRVVEIPSGRVEQEGLTDNWGYLLQSFLTQAAIERMPTHGSAEVADRYEAAARVALRAIQRYPFYAWQQGEMDGYADAVESTLYLLPRLPTPEAARWTDEQIPVLFSFQNSDGSVGGDELDGNFIRTALLYGLSLTQGTRLDPWRPDLVLGAARDGECLQLSVGSGESWQGRLRFDSPRHRQHLRLPFDYARLNEWPEWYVVEEGRRYRVTTLGSVRSAEYDGEELRVGLPVSLVAGGKVSMEVCRV